MDKAFRRARRSFTQELIRNDERMRERLPYHVIFKDYNKKSHIRDAVLNSDLDIEIWSSGDLLCFKNEQEYLAAVLIS
ncbi:MAG: hypothetical protein M0R77_18885 [Gammaproteobacteria bacterium]|nr:hypothetical protein [Gammaproteobacteria bacterium]